VTIETVFAALLFTGVFLAGGRLHPFRSFMPDRRAMISFGAGMAAAYVFVHLMPELEGAREVFAESASEIVRYEGVAIYFLALVGFLVVYAFVHLRRRLGESDEPDSERRAFRLQIGGFAVYVCVMGYLLVHGLEETSVSILIYAVAIAAHFLAVDHDFREEHGERYESLGRYVLAGAALVGWGLGALVELPGVVVALLVAFVSGAVIMNSAAMELPSEKEGRFLPFLIGGIVYGLILIPLA
jgi:hypothetical protein